MRFFFSKENSLGIDFRRDGLCTFLSHLMQFSGLHRSLVLINQKINNVKRFRQNMSKRFPLVKISNRNTSRNEKATIHFSIER